MNRKYHHDHHLTKLEVDVVHRNTADFLPQAKGSFQELDAKRQAVNNGTLVFGVVLLLSALVGVKFVPLKFNLKIKNLCYKLYI